MYKHHRPAAHRTIVHLWSAGLGGSGGRRDSRPHWKSLPCPSDCFPIRYRVTREPLRNERCPWCDLWGITEFGGDEGCGAFFGPGDCAPSRHGRRQWRAGEAQLGTARRTTFGTSPIYTFAAPFGLWICIAPAGACGTEHAGCTPTKRPKGDAGNDSPGSVLWGETEKLVLVESRRQHLLLGSAVISAGCKNIVGSRCKQPGMFRTVRPANAILVLRSCGLKWRLRGLLGGPPGLTYTFAAHNPARRLPIRKSR